jgi:hypothetical protein
MNDPENFGITDDNDNAWNEKSDNKKCRFAAATIDIVYN